MVGGEADRGAGGLDAALDLQPAERESFLDRESEGREHPEALLGGEVQVVEGVDRQQTLVVRHPRHGQATPGGDDEPVVGESLVAVEGDIVEGDLVLVPR